MFSPAVISRSNFHSGIQQAGKQNIYSPIISATTKSKTQTSPRQVNSIPWKTVLHSLFDLQRIGIAVSVTYLINQLFDFLTAHPNQAKDKQQIKDSNIKHVHNLKQAKWQDFALKELKEMAIYFTRLSSGMLASMMIFNIMPRIKRNGYKFSLEKAEVYAEKGLTEALIEPFQNNKLSLVFKLAGLNTGLQALQDIGIQVAPDNWENGINLTGALAKVAATFLAGRFILNPNTNFEPNASLMDKLVILLNLACPCHGLLICMAEIEALVNSIWQIFNNKPTSKENK